MEGLAVLRGLSPDQLKLLRPLFTLFYHPEGTLLFQQGEPADYFFILIQGEVAIRFKPEDGPELMVSHIRSEGVIGWSAAIGSPQYTSSAICTTDCKTMRVRRLALRHLYQLNPQLGSTFLQRLAELIEARLHSNHPQLIALLEQGMSLKLDQPVAAG